MSGRVFLRTGQILAGLAVLGSALVVSLELRFNRSESLPLGIYRTLRGAAPLQVGDLVAFCMTSEHAWALHDRPFAGAGSCPAATQELAKPIVAKPGDRITHSPAGVAINDQPLPFSPTYEADSQGLLMPTPSYGEYTLGADEYWVYSPYADRSLDSRSLGPITTKQIRGRIAPVLTWTTSTQRAALEQRANLTRTSGSGRKGSEAPASRGS
jgi:conjugative transfer signal peptidase TraF